MDRPTRRRTSSRRFRECGCCESCRIAARGMRCAVACSPRRERFVLFTDADLSAPIEEAGKLFEVLESAGADAAVGSRALRRDLIGIRQPPIRDYSGRCYNLLVKLFTGLRIHDTQCGFKLFRMATTRRAFELQRVEGFGFDAELLFLIERMGGMIVEVPVRWSHRAPSEVRFPRDPMLMFADLIGLRIRAMRTNYSQ